MTLQETFAELSRWCSAEDDAYLAKTASAMQVEVIQHWGVITALRQPHLISGGTVTCGTNIVSIFFGLIKMTRLGLGRTSLHLHGNPL